MQASELKSRIIYAVGWSTVAKLSAQILSWAVTLIVIRLLSPEDYGLMAISSAIIGLFITLSSGGLGDGIKQLHKITPTILRQVFAINLYITLAFIIVICGTAYPISQLYDEPRLVNMILVLSLNLPLMALYMIPRALLETRLEMKRAMFVEVWSTIIAGLTVLIMAYTGFGVWSLIAGYLMVNLVNAIGYNIIEPFMKMPQFRISPETKRVVNFGYFRTLEQLAWYLYAQADVFIIGKLVGAVPLGFYSVAKTIAMLPLNKSAAILNTVAFSAFSIVRDQREQASQYFVKALRLLSVISFPTFLGLSAVSPEVVQYILGVKWQESVLPMQLLTFASAFIMIGLVIGPYLQGIGEVKNSLRNALVGLVLFPSTIAIGCYWGIVGASVAWATMHPVFFVHNIWRVSRVTGITMAELFRSVVPSLCVSIIMYVAVRVLASYMPPDVPGIFALVLEIFAGIVIYGIGLAIVQKSAFQEIWSLLRPRS